MFHAIIQARMGSKRLPGKTLMEYKKISPLKVLLLRLKKIKEIGKLIVVTTKNKKDKSIINLCRKLNVSYYKGSANNVLLRYYSAAKRYKSKEIIRLTADNPFIDKKTLVKMINLKKIIILIILLILTPCQALILMVQILKFLILILLKKLIN